MEGSRSRPRVRRSSAESAPASLREPSARPWHRPALLPPTAPVRQNAEARARPRTAGVFRLPVRRSVPQGRSWPDAGPARRAGKRGNPWALLGTASGSGRPRGEPVDELGARANAELGTDLRQVRFHRARCHEQRCGDLAIRKPFRNHVGHLSLRWLSDRLQPVGDRRSAAARRVSAQQHPIFAPVGAAHRLLPEAGLADPRLSLQEQ